MFKNALKIIKISLILFFFFSCAAPTKIQILPQESPIIVDSEKSASISFKRTLIEIPQGTKIGCYHARWANIRHHPIYWGSTISIGTEVFGEIVNEELRNAGYKVIGGENFFLIITTHGKQIIYWVRK